MVLNDIEKSIKQWLTHRNNSNYNKTLTLNVAQVQIRDMEYFLSSGACMNMQWIFTVLAPWKAVNIYLLVH